MKKIAFNRQNAWDYFIPLLVFAAIGVFASLVIFPLGFLIVVPFAVNMSWGNRAYRAVLGVCAALLALYLMLVSLLVESSVLLIVLCLAGAAAGIVMAARAIFKKTTATK